MLTIKSLLVLVLSFLLFSGISLADTFVVTNLNDPGAGSLRQAIINSNLNPGQDEIVFVEVLEGTIVLNQGTIFIQDDLNIDGPGGGRITIDANGNSDVFAVTDFDNGINRIVNIGGLRFINGNAFEDGAIVNYEILTVFRCEFINNSATLGGGAIGNRNILTVDSCFFDSNFAPDGGAIMNYEQAISLSILNSKFVNNLAVGGAIDNVGRGGAIHNRGRTELITSSAFTDNTAISGGAIHNAPEGTIKEISHSTFNNNITTGEGGAITNICGFIETIVNSTFNKNSARSGGAIWNNSIINISFTTISGNQSIRTRAGGIMTAPPCRDILPPVKIPRSRNSIIAFNSPNNCSGPVNDFGGNYSDDFSCGFTGDDSVIILGPLADNGGPTETMNLIGWDPFNGATINCDALDENGNPTGRPIGVDQRYFPRPFGVRCDSGAFESQPVANVTITKVTDPSVDRNFRFGSGGFNPLQECPLDGGGDGVFVLSDGQSISCNVPQGNYSINEIIPQGYELLIFCIEAPDNIVINNETGDINFTIEDSGSDVDCIYTNIKKGSGGGGCALASGSNNSSLPLFLLIPALIMIRRVAKRYRN